MLSNKQVGSLVAVSLAMWAAATLYIRFLPGALVSPIRGAFGFVTTFPIAWLSVVLTQHIGRLSSEQLLSGVAVVGAVAMMIDGVALRWFPGVYGPDPTVLILGAAWLLWGYGVSLGVAVVRAARQAKR